MTEQPNSLNRWGGESTTTVETYRSLCIPAAIGFVAGLLSVAVLFHPGFAFLSVVAVVSGLIGVWRVGSNSERLVGRGLALAGVGLALFCVTTRWVAVWHYRTSLEGDAVAIAEQYIACLQAGEPQMAHQLKVLPWKRSVAEDPSDVLEGYYRNVSSLESLLDLAGQPLAHALLLLGDRATVRFYGVEKVNSTGDEDYFELIFVATYSAPLQDLTAETGLKTAGQTEDVSDTKPTKKSFFFRVGVLRGKRSVDKTYQSGWCVISSGNTDPPAGWKRS